MTPDAFRSYLRDLQNKGPYQWPNDYFAWEKPDKTLFMVGISSTQMNHILKYQVDEDRNQRRISFGLEPDNVYCAFLYGISPTVGYYKSGGIRFDPVEELVQEVSAYRFLGSWRDPDLFMDDPYHFSRTIAHGRWELAKQHIMPQERKPSLGEQISQAEGKTSVQNPQQGRGSPDFPHTDMSSISAGRD